MNPNKKFLTRYWIRPVLSGTRDRERVTICCLDIRYVKQDLLRLRRWPNLNGYPEGLAVKRDTKVVVHTRPRFQDYRPASQSPEVSSPGFQH